MAEVPEHMHGHMWKHGAHSKHVLARAVIRPRAISNLVTRPILITKSLAMCARMFVGVDLYPHSDYPITHKAITL